MKLEMNKKPSLSPTVLFSAFLVLVGVGAVLFYHRRPSILLSNSSAKNSPPPLRKGSLQARKESKTGDSGLFSLWSPSSESHSSSSDHDRVEKHHVQPTRKHAGIQTPAQPTGKPARGENVPASSSLYCYGKFAAFVKGDIALPALRPRVESAGRRNKPACWRILLVVLFNHNFYRIIPFLRRLYSPAFGQHIAFYGDEDDPGHPDVVKAPLRKKQGTGLFQHLVMAQAMREKPNYNGYLFIADDLLLNYGKVLSTKKLHPNKIWVTRWTRTANIFHPDPKTLRWHHWRAKWGLPAVRQAVPCLSNTFWNQLEKSIGCKRCVAKTASDIAYLPRQFASQFSKFAYIFRNSMNEIAIPSIVRAIASQDEIELMDGTYLWKKKRSHVVDYLTKKALFVHPVKFSNFSLRRLAKKWLASSNSSRQEFKICSKR